VGEGGSRVGEGGSRVLIIIPVDSVGGGGVVVELLREGIPTGLGQRRFTLPAFFRVYSSLVRSDLTHSFRHEAEINLLSI
jgi:hypothetical protein